MVCGRLVNVTIFDSSSIDEEYDNLRRLNYPQTNVFMLLFSVISPASFDNVSKWHAEISYFCPSAPIVLVGIQCDLREDQETINILREKGLAPISFEQGISKAKEILAETYLECSTNTLEGVSQAFHTCIEVALPDTGKKEVRKKTASIFANQQNKVKAHILNQLKSSSDTIIFNSIK